MSTEKKRETVEMVNVSAGTSISTENPPFKQCLKQFVKRHAIFLGWGGD